MSLTPRLDRLENGLIINGNFDHWQRGASFSLVNTYSADRWRFNGSHGATGTITRQNGGPDSKSAFFLRLNVSAADVSIAASDNYIFTQYVEGFVFRPAFGKKLTVSFWIRSTLTGTFCVSLGNNGTRSYVKTLTINSANTWEKKVFTIDHDTAGTWDLTNGRGLAMHINLIPGSDFITATPNQWINGLFLNTSGNINFLGSTGNTFDFAQAQILYSDTELEDPEFNARLYDSELALCQRYYRDMPHVKGMIISATTVAAYESVYPIMRAAPSISVNGTAILNAQNGLDNGTQSSPQLTTSFSGSNFVIFTAANFSGLTTGRPIFIGVPANNSNSIRLDAEL